MMRQIDPADWPALSELLERALSLSVSERDSFVDTLDERYSSLKPQLKELLSAAAHVETRDFLDTLPKFQLPTVPTDRAGVAIGCYRLIRKIGVGGMGEVWLAERNDGVMRREVALKLPHVSRPGAGLAERMAREREILAQLNHPNIATLYDAGVAADGQPFLALEYVEGTPIDIYCAEHALDLRSRLKLLLQVGNAVAHAHAKLIVHRDIKPSNILVRNDGQARLLDFGIAKLLGDSHSSDAQVTELTGRALTPDYASPEQIMGNPIGVASDVYSLGVVLYELLTGARPYRLKRDSRGALEDAIVQVDPKPPSELVDRSQRRALRGDVDAIVLKALKKDIDERYPTVHALVEDLYRYLDGRPISAQADAATYRFKKFVARNKLATGAAAAIAISLVSGAALAMWQMQEAREQRDIAKREAVKAERTSALIESVFSSIAPEQARGREVTVREAVDAALPKIAESVKSEPAVQARMLRTLGYVYMQLGDNRKAKDLLDRAIESARSAKGEGEHELAFALMVRAQLQRFEDDFAGAEKIYREALELQQSRPDADRELTRKILNGLALVLRAKDPEQALRMYREVRQQLLDEFGMDSPEAADIAVNIGGQLIRMQRYVEAGALLEEVKPVYKRLRGDRDPRYGALLNNLSVVAKELGQYERAIELLREDEAMLAEVYGPQHREVATTKVNLARTMQRMGAYDEAIERIDQALTILHANFAGSHGLILSALDTRALIQTRLGRFADARDSLAKALAAKPTSLEGNIAQNAGRLTLAEIELYEGQYGKAQRLAEQVLAAAEKERGARALSRAQFVKACALGATGQIDEGQAALREAIQSRSDGTSSAEQITALMRSKYSACVGDRAAVIAQLDEAKRLGLNDRSALDDPILVRYR